MAARLDLVRTGIDVGILMKDEAAMVRFYRDGLGLVLIHRREMPETSPYAGRRTHAFALGESVLKLWALDDSEGIADPVAERDGQLGMRYFTIFVDGVEAILARLKAEGYDVVEQARRSELGAPLTWSFVRDPDGNYIELIQLEDPKQRLSFRGE